MVMVTTWFAWNEPSLNSFLFVNCVMVTAWFAWNEPILIPFCFLIVCC